MPTSVAQTRIDQQQEMAGVESVDDLEKARENSGCSSFVWDENSNLYFHASSGFYHDANAGWYYSSRDGLYYTFENGSYVPLTFDKDEQSQPPPLESTSHAPDEPVEHETCNEENFTGDGLENERPPSEWLEETLINIYLSGNSNVEASAENSTTLESYGEEERNQVSCEGLADQSASDKVPACQQVEQVEEEWIPEDTQDAETLTSICSVKANASLDEENWQAQYGQVVRATDEGVPHVPVSDLWDWEVVLETVKKRHQVARLFGRLVRSSSKLHPSVPSGSGLLKTASIREVHLDLVRVASGRDWPVFPMIYRTRAFRNQRKKGKVYRLRTPNKRYLATSSTYDSSNPTKDWGFPDLFVNMQNNDSVGFKQTCGIISPNGGTRGSSSVTQDIGPALKKHCTLPYRDRAAERRTLHGEFSIGPGQKKSLDDNMYEEESTSQISDPEEAALEAMNMTFGRGSYGRRVLEKMGWKDGEALGSSTKGILEPLQAVGNKGFAGLGFNRTS